MPWFCPVTWLLCLQRKSYNFLCDNCQKALKMSSQISRVSSICILYHFWSGCIKFGRVCAFYSRLSLPAGSHLQSPKALWHVVPAFLFYACKSRQKCSTTFGLNPALVVRVVTISKQASTNFYSTFMSLPPYDGVDYESCPISDQFTNNMVNQCIQFRHQTHMVF